MSDRIKDVVMTLIICTLIGVVLTAPVQCSMHEDEVILKAVQAGADPLATKCAIISHMDWNVCAILAARGKREEEPK